MLLLNFSIAQNAKGIFFLVPWIKFSCRLVSIHHMFLSFIIRFSVYLCSYRAISFQCLMLNVAALTRPLLLYNLGRFSILTVSVPTTRI